MGRGRALLERLAAAFVSRFKGFKVYLSHPSGGFTGYGIEENLTPISEERWQRILQVFVKGELFDCLHLTRHNDPYGGFTLAHREGEVELMCSFLVLKFPEKVTAYRDAMKSCGYIPADEFPWNVGLGEDMENLSLTYRCQPEFQAVLELSQHALDLLDGPSKDLYIHIFRSQDGPDGRGVKVIKPQNILEQIP